ncbi:MAG: indolepyruvate oxidoreductase subunit beta [Anaerolineaceae bacterium]|jgi:indolepyruvate ferredoxin oxidoreductase beta subunit|nr:indolepyruvate oxidoreductase subunit beta [Anaerolineaceae bacterium]
MTSPTNPKTVNFLLVGVGGQGTILASNVLAELGLSLGYDVKQAEVHGMSQRGGSVTSQVRWSDHVYSPMISPGEVDFLIAFEKSEAARFIHYLSPSGTLIVNDHTIVPITVTTGAETYPPHASIQQILTGYTNNIVWLDGVGEARKAGNPKSSNVVVLGALSAYFDFPIERWESVLEGRVPPRYLEINKKAFQAGRRLMAV